MVTTELTSKVTPAASLAGVTLATTAPSAGALRSVRVLSDQVVSATLSSLTVPGRWCSSRVSVSVACFATVPVGSAPTVNLRNVTIRSPFSVPATSLVMLPSLKDGRAVEV